MLKPFDTERQCAGAKACELELPRQWPDGRCWRALKKVQPVKSRAAGCSEVKCLIESTPRWWWWSLCRRRLLAYKHAGYFGSSRFLPAREWSICKQRLDECHRKIWPTLNFNRNLWRIQRLGQSLFKFKHSSVTVKLVTEPCRLGKSALNVSETAQERRKVWVVDQPGFSARFK